jgi:hypothetical protein
MDSDEIRFHKDRAAESTPLIPSIVISAQYLVAAVF